MSEHTNKRNDYSTQNLFQCKNVNLFFKPQHTVQYQPPSLSPISPIQSINVMMPVRLSHSCHYPAPVSDSDCKRVCSQATGCSPTASLRSASCLSPVGFVCLFGLLSSYKYFIYITNCNISLFLTIVPLQLHCGSSILLSFVAE